MKETKVSYYKEEIMDTKQDKIITYISVALASIVLLVVIACNVGNDSSKSNLESKTVSEEAASNYEDLGLEASLVKVNEIIVGLSLDDANNETDVENNSTTQEIEDTTKSEYADKFLVNVNEFVNVRAEALAEAALVGKIYAGGGGDVLEKGSEWTKVQSGNVIGYIKNEFAYFGDDIEAHITECANIFASSTVDMLRIRQSADAGNNVIATINAGAEIQVIEKGDEWTSVNYIGQTAYVATSYLKFEYEMAAGVTVEEEQAAIAAEAERQRLAQEAAAAEEQRRQQAYQLAVEASKFVDTVQTSGYNLSEQDAYLIACVVASEAGGDIYEDQLAVANVILNRLNGGRYGSSVYDVVYARGQFTVATNGMLARAMANGPGAVAIQATKDALSGINNVPNYCNFASLRAANFSAYSQYTIIGAQVFYR